MNTETDTKKIEALCKAIDCAPEDLSLERHDYYGLEVYSLGQQEYAIGGDSECDAAAYDAIEQSLWAFNASFILSECNLPMELEEAIQSMQKEKCEDCNEAIKAMIEGSCGLEDFSSSALGADGRGHFLSQYDGNETEEGDFFIYRLN